MFDDSHLLVTFVGSEAPLQWPLFLLNVESTANFADDSTLRVADLVIVASTMRYTSKDGAARKLFVIRKVASEELPPYIERTAQDTHFAEPQRHAQDSELPSQVDVETRTRPDETRQEHEAAIAGISAAIKTFEANVAKNKELLKPIESRVFRNTLKNDKTLTNAIEKDKARAQEYKDAIAADEKRITELKAKLAKEQAAIGDNGNQP